MIRWRYSSPSPCIELLLGRRDPGIGLLGLFVMQMGVGAVVGLAIGKLSVTAINRVNLQAAGLYPIVTAAAGVFAFGVAAVLGGSGFLSVYLAGIVIGNSELVFRRGTLLFIDAAAWLSQIGMLPSSWTMHSVPPPKSACSTRPATSPCASCQSPTVTWRA
jgi:hypothetical protein